MEFKIRLLARLFAICAGILCVLLSADELLPTSEVNETVAARTENRYEEGTSLYIDFFIETNTHRKIEVPIEKYQVISVNDHLNLFVTPIFHQLKAFECISSKTSDITQIGNPDLPREVPFIASVLVVVLAVLSAFFIKRFELSVALAFIALVITAVRWWFIGI